MEQDLKMFNLEVQIILVLGWNNIRRDHEDKVSYNIGNIYGVLLNYIGKS
jgi:hypothetical protein